MGNILKKEKIIEIVENWLKKNSFSDHLEPNFWIRNNQFCVQNIVEIDVRDGEIRANQCHPNTWDGDEKYWIELVGHQQFEIPNECVNDETGEIDEELLEEYAYEYLEDMDWESNADWRSNVEEFYLDWDDDQSM